MKNNNFNGLHCTVSTVVTPDHRIIQASCQCTWETQFLSAWTAVEPVAWATVDVAAGSVVTSCTEHSQFGS